MERLAAEGAPLLTTQPAAAAELFERAHDIALALGAADYAASMSTLIARTWTLRQSLVRSIRFSHRAVDESPTNAHAFYTLGHFLENAAMLSERAMKGGRAAILYRAAGDAFTNAAKYGSEADARTRMHEAAARCTARMRMFARSRSSAEELDTR
jgi:HD-like signal output (HDOD) protein